VVVGVVVVVGVDAIEAAGAVDVVRFQALPIGCFGV
jgi:hypothetical protein